MTADHEPTEARSVGTLLSLNVGLPKDVPWKETTVYTGIYKHPVDGPRLVRTLNVDGDGQGDLKGHGGEQRAILVYQRESYDHWAGHLGRDDLVPGSFGENFTVAGLSDDVVCIGDRYRIGEAEFEVTQPRVTCYRVGMRLGLPQMPSLLVAHRRPGFYLRVITEGVVTAGDAIFKVGDGRHQLSVAAVDALLYLPDKSHDLLKLAVDVPALSPGWQGSFRDLLAAADAGDGASQPEIGTEPGWSGFRPLIATQVVRETPSVISLYLRDRSGASLPAAMPGQYLTIRVPVNATTAIRSYSISGHPDASTYRISVKREEHGTVSRLIHDTIRPGSVLDVAAPRGDFILAAGDEPVLLLSAGIGITPVLAMLASIAETDPSRPVWWFHVARTPDDYALAAEVEKLLQHLPQARSLIYLTRSTLPATGTTPGTVPGRLDLEQLRMLELPTESSAYICGPTGFISGMTEALERIGISPTHIHAEIFGALAPLNPGVAAKETVAVHAPAGPPGAGPAVTFARSGLSVNWSDAFGSLLELAEACDVPTRWSCRTGVCHNCVTGLVSGSVDYAPEPLERPDPSEVLICCSQPAYEVVLDA